jgi:hypothetical protein
LSILFREGVLPEMQKLQVENEPTGELPTGKVDGAVRLRRTCCLSALKESCPVTYTKKFPSSQSNSISRHSVAWPGKCRYPGRQEIADMILPVGIET